MGVFKYKEEQNKAKKNKKETFLMSYYVGDSGAQRKIWYFSASTTNTSKKGISVAGTN